MLLTSDKKKILIASPVKRFNFGDFIQFIDTVNLLKKQLDVVQEFSIILKYFTQDKFDLGVMSGLTIGHWLEYFFRQTDILRRTCKKTILMPSSIISTNVPKIKEKYKSALTKYDAIFVRGEYSQNFIKEELGISPITGIDQVLHFFSNAPRLKTGNKNIIASRNDYKPFYPKICSEKILRYFTSLSNKIYVFCAEKDEKSVRENAPIIFLYSKLKSLKIKNPSNVYNLLKALFDGLPKTVYSMRLHFGLAMMCMNVPTILITPVYELKALDIRKYVNNCIVDFVCKIMLNLIS